MNNLSIKGILHIIIICICMLSSQRVWSQTNTPKRLSSEDIVVISPYVKGFAWVKTSSIHKKEQRALSLKSIGVGSSPNQKDLHINNGVLMGQDSIVYFDYPFDSCMHKDIVDYVISHGGHPMTKTQIKRCMLKLTQSRKTHLLNTIISKREWDY